MKNIARGVGLALLALTICGRTHGQCQSAGFSAQWFEQGRKVVLKFTIPAIAPASSDAQVRVAIFNATNHMVESVSGISYMTLSGDGAAAGSEVWQAAFTPVGNIDLAAGNYVVSVTNLKYRNCQDARAVTGFAKLTAALEPPSERVPITLSATTGRDDSDLYVSGQLNGATGAEPSYTFDVKAQVRIPLGSLPFVKNNRFRPGIWFVPSVDLKVSTDPKMNANAVLIGAAVPFGFPTNKNLITWIQPEPAFFLEADKRFRVVNPVFRGRIYFLSRTFGSGSVHFVPQAFVGMEAGANSKTSTPGSHGGRIIRPTVGVHSYLNLFYSEKTGRRAFFEADFVRRWPLNSEPRFSEDSSGNLILDSVGKRPRNYVWTKLQFDFNEYFGVTAGYDYGELPPVYTRVRNKFTVGLVLKSGLVFKPK